MNGQVLVQSFPVSLWQLLCKEDGTCRQCGKLVQNIILYPNDIMVRHANALHFCTYTYGNPTRKEVLVP